MYVGLQKIKGLWPPPLLLRGHAQPRAFVVFFKLTAARANFRHNGHGRFCFIVTNPKSDSLKGACHDYGKEGKKGRTKVKGRKEEREKRE